MNEYLGFVDEIGRTRDGKYLYRLDFTIDTETIWGEWFNIAPSAIIPDLQPDKNSLSSRAKIVFPRELVIAKRNYCFSMQDCIDGIIPLCFCEIDENTVEYNDKPFFLNFGESFDNVKKILDDLGIEMFDIEEVDRGDDSIINDLLDSMDNNVDDDPDDDDFDPNF